MTDQYNMEPDEHEVHAEGEHPTERKAEAWQSDQPPDDDFEDPGTEDTATASEEMGAALHEDTSGSEPKKTPALLPIIAVFGGVLFLGAVLYWQFGRSSSTAPVTPPVPVQTQAASGFAPETAKVDVAPKTALAPAAPAPSPAAMTSGLGGTAMPGAAPAASIPPAPAPSAPSFAAAPPAANNDALEAHLTNLDNRVDELKKAFDQVTQQLAQMNAALFSPSGAMEDRLAKIEQQLQQIRHAETAPPQAPAPAAPPAAAPADSTQAAEAAIDASVAKIAAHKQNAHTKSHAHKVKHTARAPAVKWVLRAATPGEAWVAKDETTGELRHVRVGDELQGIGRIKAIRQDGNAWTVEGSAGIIR